MIDISGKSFGLTDRNIKTLYDIFNKYSEVTEVYIFGSRAKGNYKAGSDIDLAIMNTGIGAKTVSRILSECAESSLPFKVDLVDFHSLKSNDFIEHIQRAGTLFYKKKKL